MIQKRMCRRCKVVVQFKSANLLIHTANCRFTPLVSKKNALDQSRNKEVPSVSLDSREGKQREILDAAKEEDRGREARDAVLGKRPLSESGLDKEAKRSKSDRITRRLSKECQPKDCSRLHLAMTKAIIGHNLPFSICDRKNSYDTPFLEMLKEFKPDYPTCCKPNSDKFRNSYLPLYYEEVMERVLRALNLSLSGTYAHGTIMFDGWEDINGNAVINVMLRVTSSLVYCTATFLLDSVYTKDKKVDAEKYVEIIEQVMRKFQGQRSSPFTGINGVVSDSARACVKAKNLLAAKHAGIVTIQDQAHAADLLMSDLGKLPWVEEVLNKVNVIVQALRSNRKLLCRYKDLIEMYNAQLKRQKERSRNAARLGPPAADLWSLIDTWDLDELERDLTTRDANSSVAQHGITSKSSSDQNLLDRSREPKRTAVTLKKPVKTRFASTETMLEGYLRSRPVLKQLTRDAEFDRLYDGSRVANREKRDKTFVDVIDDDLFYSNVGDVHHILRFIRRYLRVWDAENAQVSEVVPATLLLEYTLGRIKTTPFFSEDRKREVFEVLERRCRGSTTERGSIQIRILQDVHYTAWLLDPNLCPLNVTEFLPAFERHAKVYLAGAKSGRDENDCKKIAHTLTRLYREVHKVWDVMRKGVKNRAILESYAGHALRYWEDESPAETVLKEDDTGLAVDLQCFARYTLSLCPSSCATERSFSHQGRIHTKQRSRLKPETVQKLLFCKWNARVLNNIDRVEFDKDRDADKFKLGVLHPFEDVLGKPTTTSIFGDAESEQLLKNVVARENRTMEQIKHSRGMLYNNPQVYIYQRSSRLSLRPEASSSQHPVSTSALLNNHESTVVGIEHSVRTRSPPIPDGTRTFHASTTEELAVLLSASKDHSSRPRRSFIESVGVTQPLVYENTAEGADKDTAAEELRDEDNTTISVATARAMLKRDSSAPKESTLNIRSPPARDTSCHDVDTPSPALDGRMRGIHQNSSAENSGVNLLLGSRSRGRGRGRPNMSYVPIRQKSLSANDLTVEEDDESEKHWENDEEDY